MNWIHAVSLNKDTVQLLDANTVGKYAPLPLCNILQAQKEDADVAHVLAYKKQPLRPTFQDRQGESAEVKALMHEWSKLMIGKDGALYQKASQQVAVSPAKKISPTCTLPSSQ